MTITAPWQWPTIWRYRRKIRKLHEEIARAEAAIATRRAEIADFKAQRAVADERIRANVLFACEWARVVAADKTIVPDDCTPEKLADPDYAAMVARINAEWQASMDAALAKLRAGVAL